MIGNASPYPPHPGHATVPAGEPGAFKVSRNRLVVRPGVLLSRGRLEDAARTASAKTFYVSLFAWTVEAFGGDQDYTLFKRGEEKVGGMVKCPQPGLPAGWFPYVLVEDVDAIAGRKHPDHLTVCVVPFIWKHPALYSAGFLELDRYCASGLDR